MQSTKQANGKLSSLEGLRGLMALWVFVTHYVTIAGFDISKDGRLGFFLGNGEHAVSVFILLSGFVIALLFARKHEAYLPFITRRAFRLFPAYLVALALSVATLNVTRDVLQNFPWPNEKSVIRLKIIEDTLAHEKLHLVLHIPLLHGLVPERVLPNTSYAFMGQAWSLTLEWQYYLLAPFLAALLYQRIKALSSVVATAVLLGTYLFHRNGGSAFILNSLHLFIGGMVTYRLYEIAIQSKHRLQQILPLLLLGGIWVAAADFRHTAIAVAIWLLAIFGELQTDAVSAFVNRVLTHPYIVWNGRSSYSFYCLHMVVLYTTAFILLRMLKMDNQLLYAASLLMVSLPITMVLSALSFRWVEQPFMNWGKLVAQKFSQKRLPESHADLIKA